MAAAGLDASEAGRVDRASCQHGMPLEPRRFLQTGALSSSRCHLLLHNCSPASCIAGQALKLRQPSGWQIPIKWVGNLFSQKQNTNNTPTTNHNKPKQQTANTNMHDAR